MKKTAPKKKNTGFKAGAIAFGATALLYALLFPLYRIGDFLLCGALAFLAGKVVSIMCKGLDLTTHNKPRNGEQEAAPVADIPLSGDEKADEVIAKGQEMLHQIRAENDAITDEALSAQMDELERLCVQIFTTVSEKPQKAGQIRKFMSYYLPTTLKMLASYHKMLERGVSVADMTAARNDTMRGMGMVLTACQKQLDNLYKDTILDVSTDIDVLEQMMRRDGYSESELGRAVQPTAQPAPTATSAQMKASNPPVLETPSQDDDFVSFYSQKRHSDQ